MFSKLRLYLKHFDWILLAAVLILISFGLVEIYSIALGQETALLNFKKQVLFVLLSILIFFIFSFFDYHNIRSSSNYIYLVGLLLLVGVLIFGEDIRGTKGWYTFGALSLQPVEFVKFALLIFLSRYFSSNPVTVNPLKHFVYSGLGTMVLVLLVLRQPDFGSAMILFLFWGVMLFISGFKKSYIMVIAAGLVITFVGGWFFFFADYQKERIVTFFNPKITNLDQGYNIAQATIAVGSGQLVGRGLGFGSQSQLRFLPEAQNDFIFAVIAEELGLLGVFILLLIFGVIFYRLLAAARHVNNDFGIYYLLSVAVLIFIEMFINIGMNIGIVPVVGISLPFLSYGGSAIISTMMILGVAESIIIRSKLKY